MHGRKPEHGQYINLTLDDVDDSGEGARDGRIAKVLGGMTHHLREPVDVRS